MQGEIRQWVDEKAQRAEEAEGRGDVKELYNITKKLSKRGFRRNKPVRNNNTRRTVKEMERIFFRNSTKI
jgi:hypothetical protein